MGLFGLFGSKEEREQGALKKLAKKVTERYGPPENRQKAMQQLSDMGTPAALRTLCRRFTVRAEPGITDDEEKETTRRMLVDEGAEAIGPIEGFVREEEDGIAWALRALAEIAPAQKVLAVVVEELSRLGKIYTRDPEKKLVLLTWLREHHAGAGSADVEAALLPLLEDFSDDVRITATRALVSVSPGERARDALIQLLLRDRDNARVRGEVFDALAALGADVKGHRPAVEALLVEPFFLDREGRVKKRG
ncbi:MAG TPA: HEAT repeat domain-containing protein [Anaeromyxobacter sp.]|nr:HEAT repeat domain-containing protein [Anaeromyxobacter sp.]